MPKLETVDYARFNYEETPLSLDEAVNKAANLRKNDAAHFYRVESVDEAGNNFTVTKVSVASVYADFLARVAKLIGRHKLRLQR